METDENALDSILYSLLYKINQQFLSKIYFEFQFKFGLKVHYVSGRILLWELLL